MPCSCNQRPFLLNIAAWKPWSLELRPAGLNAQFFALRIPVLLHVLQPVPHAAALAPVCGHVLLQPVLHAAVTAALLPTLQLYSLVSAALLPTL